MPLVKLLVFTLMSVLISACTSVPIYSMYKLAKLDPLTANPEHIRIAIRTHEGVVINKGDVKMELGYQADDDSLIIADIYLVEVSQNPVLSKALFAGLQQNEKITLLNLSSDDAQQMRNVQKLVSQHQA
ncbi:hypothetical protein [Aliiglaciecola sp. LCG003]|uniref:hypothetical protein n=1 Tax=Aliiglaciecola sp. LCG003 TaxID=3053655 RepID=UPI00257370CC|nr:hypothetical protein [Aliiglaciecola sp. LCG003]WJG09623.1 hypothetical protein QR722_00880 [Aliiglaciecola sp. LCG003]